MKKFLQRIGWLGLVFVLMVVTYSTFCDWFFSNPKYLDHVRNKRSWCLKKNGEEFGFAVLGSSRAFGSFDMRRFSDILKEKCINLGANGSGYADNYLILYEFLKNGNSINQLLLQVDIYSLNSKMSFSNAFHTYQFLPYWNDSTVQMGLAPYLDSKERILWKYFPYIRYFKYNKYFSPKEVLLRYKQDDSAVSPFDVTFGGPQPDEVEDLSENAIFTQSALGERTIDSNDARYLLKIIELCQKNRIQVVAYKAPEYVLSRTRIPNYVKLYASIDSILDVLKINYIRGDEKIEEDESNFVNMTHLSKAGRTTFTEYFASLLKE